MDLATISVYLKVLDDMRRDPETAAWAAEVQRELAHPLNRIEDYFKPIAIGAGLSKYEQLLSFKVRQTLAKRLQPTNTNPTKD